MRSLFISLILPIAFFAGPLRAADDAAMEAVKAADDARVAATLSGDATKLSAVLSDELRYAHSSGAIDTKASFLAGVASGRLKYTQFEYGERNFKLAAPHVAVMTGRANVKTGSGTGPSEMVLGFLAVWREEEGHWRFYAWQSCRLTPTPAPAK
jgi:hypothetical protein